MDCLIYIVVGCILGYIVGWNCGVANERLRSAMASIGVGHYEGEQNSQ